MKKPKILLYDIETAPNLAWVWGKWQQDVIAYEQETYMLSYAYKWLGEKGVHCKRLCDFRCKTDEKLVRSLWKLYDKADIVIAHNGDRFDQKKTRARFIYHGMEPPAPFESVDTLKIAKKYFKFNSNRLDDLGNYLGVGRKVKHTGFDLWKGCMEGDSKSWNLLGKYNKQDVRLLERVYKQLLPWMDTHPSLSLLQGLKDGCPKCGSGSVIKDGIRAKTRMLKQQWKCKDCRGYFLTPIRKI